MNRVIKQVKHQELLSHIKNGAEMIEESIKAIIYFPVLIGILISLKLFGHTFLSYTFDESWPFLIIDYYDKFLLDNYMEIVDKEKTITMYSCDNGEGEPITTNILYTKLVTDEYYLRHVKDSNLTKLKGNLISNKTVGRLAINGVTSIPVGLQSHTSCKIIIFPRKN